MNRRDLLKTLPFLFAVSPSLTSKRLHAQENLGFSRIAENRQAHPLYFDGLSFLSDDPEDIGKSGLSGFILDVSAVETTPEGIFVRPLIPCLKSISQAAKLLQENELGLFLATKGSQILEAQKTGKTAVFLQFQSCEPFDDDIELMDVFHFLGLRILQFTHHATNRFAGGSLEKEWTGLTKLGYLALERMNKLNIVPDLSHANEIVAREVLKTSTKPVVVTHSACRAIVNNARLLPDDVIKGVADSGGVMGIFSMSFWLTNEPDPDVDSYIRQLEHVIKVGGIDAVGISNDYTIAGQLQAAKLNNDNSEAIKSYFPWWKRQEGILGFDELPRHCVIPELNNVRRLFTIQAALEKKGYSAVEIEKIMGLNWVRVLTEYFG